MDIIEKYSIKSNGIPGQINEENNISTLLEEMQITFPDKSSYDVYHKAIRDYFESLDTVLGQFHDNT